MWWWWRVNCYPIQKYWWSEYRRSCMYQMYRWWQYLFYCTNIGIMECSDVFQIVWNGLFIVGVIWINVDWVGIFVVPDYNIFTPKFFNSGIIFTLRIFENFVASKFFHFHFSLHHAKTIPCSQDPKSRCWSRRYYSCLLC